MDALSESDCTGSKRFRVSRIPFISSFMKVTGCSARQRTLERQRLKTFGKTYLKCAWFNAGESEERHLRDLLAESFR